MSERETMSNEPDYVSSVDDELREDNQGHPSEPTADALPPIPEARRALLESAIDHWKKQLIDPGRNNRLLYYKDLRTKTLRLNDLSAGAKERLITGKPVALEELLPETLVAVTGDLFDADRFDESEEDISASRERRLADFRKRARNIFRDAQAFFEEQGLETLYLALGAATWDDGGGANDRRPAAPVLLLPISLDPKGSGANKTYTVEAVGEAIVNPVLLHALDELGTRIDPTELTNDLAGMVDEVPGIRGVDELTELFTRLEAKARSVRGFEIQHAAVISTFAYYKQAMVRDLEESREEIMRHELIGALAGDPDLASAVTREFTDPEPRTFDAVQARRFDLILDADSSQEAAIRRVLDGQSIVIQGPPGTGKSQTISNMVGALTHAGKSMLFVAEKRAAIEAVAKRLRAAGLGHLMLDLHGRGISRKQMASQLKSALDGIRGTIPDQNSELYRKHDRTSKRLVDHHDRMHAPRAPADISIYDMRSVMVATPPRSQWKPPLKGHALSDFVDKRDELKDRLHDLGEFADLLSGETKSPWMDGRVGEEEFDYRGSVTALGEALEALKQMDDALETTGVAVPSKQGLDRLREIERILLRHNELARNWRPSVWSSGVLQIRRALEPAGTGFVAHCKAMVSSSGYRAARGRLKAHAVSEFPGFDTPLGVARRLESALATWTEISEVRMPPDVSLIATAAEAIWRVLRCLDELETHFPTLWDDNTSLTSIRGHVTDLDGDRINGQRLFVCHKQLRELAELFPKLYRNVTELLATPVEGWGVAVDHAIARNSYQQELRRDPSIEGFSGKTHDKTVTDFQGADRELLGATALRVAREHGKRFITVCNDYPDEHSILKREAEKRSRHKSLRQLMVEAPHVLTALFPCWMASPLSVSQLLAPQMRFDVVLFDEASQVFPWDAVPSILRGEQLVVAGDRHQMPPTNFFNTQEAEDVTEEPEAHEGFESLLEQASSFLQDCYLAWHYRSRDEKLIAFSNYHVYQGSLITFPGSGRERTPLHAEVLEFSGVYPVETASGGDEVQRVVALVLEHAVERPGESLGVIAFGVRHARRIEAALDQALADMDVADREGLEKFFDPSSEERFFVKNLERVQGDERSSIILSVGYAKDRGGNLPHRFGPLTQEGGYRRFNVAVSRARRHMTVVSSFSWRDVDLSRSSARGVKFLKDFLRYAETGGEVLTDGEFTQEPMNPWELEVYDRLQEAGLELIPQYGTSGFRIDMVAKHPERQGEFVLAIECDGATYHSSPIARERDRLRQQILENLGWRFHRIWSTDWWNDATQEIEKVQKAYERALRRASDQEGPERAEDPDSTGFTKKAKQETESESAPRAAPKPAFRRGRSIDEYSFSSLKKLAEWVCSDGVLRTDEEIVEEMFRELHYSRRGARILARLKKAVDATRAK